MKTETQTNVFDRAVSFLSGLSMIVAPVATMIAFYIHPQFWTFKRESSAAIQYEYIQDAGWQIGHSLVYVTIPFVILMWLQIAVLLSKRRPALAVAGGLLSLVGWSFMAGQFGTTMAQGMIGLAFPKEQALDGIQLLLDRPGLMQLTMWGQVGALLGPMILSIAMALTPEVAPRWQGVLAILGNLIIVAALDIDGYMIIGEFMIMLGLWPTAVKLIKGKWSEALVSVPAH